ncbi:MAG TPA: DinB family protein [Gemmatimonadaceae bacterium]|nr:DinB family protein [Gemmatimonadaceae bacterium]
MLLPLYDHLAWADAQALAAIRAMPESAERERAATLYAHLAAAENVWLARLEHRAPSYAIWPALSLETAADVAQASAVALRTIAAGDPASLRQTISYGNSSGVEYRNTVADILLHVALHGSYHRGQIALLARQGGGAPAVTEYIAYMREQNTIDH